MRNVGEIVDRSREVILNMHNLRNDERFSPKTVGPITVELAPETLMSTIPREGVRGTEVSSELEGVIRGSG